MTEMKHIPIVNMNGLMALGHSQMSYQTSMTSSQYVRDEMTFKLFLLYQIKLKSKTLFSSACSFPLEIEISMKKKENSTCIVK